MLTVARILCLSYRYKTYVMKLKMIEVVFFLILSLFVTEVANAQHWRGGYRHGWYGHPGVRIGVGVRAVRVGVYAPPVVGGYYDDYYGYPYYGYYGYDGYPRYYGRG